MLKSLNFVEDCLDETSLSNLPSKFAEFAESIKN